MVAPASWPVNDPELLYSHGNLGLESINVSRDHVRSMGAQARNLFTQSVSSKIQEAPTHKGISMVLPAHLSSQKKSIVSLCCDERKYKLRVLA